MIERILIWILALLSWPWFKNRVSGPSPPDAAPQLFGSTKPAIAGTLHEGSDLVSKVTTARSDQLDHGCEGFSHRVTGSGDARDAATSVSNTNTPDNTNRRKAS